MFKAEIVGYLDKIEAHCKKAGLQMSKLTLLMRNPVNDEMAVLLTNETPDELRAAIEKALAQEIN